MPRKRPAKESVERLDARSAWGDQYLLFLLVVLAGYALLGKGFAHLGVAPMFIGEIALVLGALVIVRPGLVLACLTSLPSALLAVLMGWTAIRTIPFIESHGWEALRDSVVCMYGAFAFILVGLLLQDGRRLSALVDAYGSFLRIFIPVIPVLFAGQYYFRAWLPNMPGTDVPFLLLGPGEVPVHLAGAAVFALVGLHRPKALWVVALAAAVVMTSALTRGGMLAFVLPVAIAALLMRKVRQVGKIVAFGLAIFLAAYAVEKTITDDRDRANSVERQFTPGQLVENAQSIFGHVDPKLEGSRRWRLQWWDIILRDTVLGGANFWSGRGFGLNIAVVDGFEGEYQENGLRSPHNVFMTILARAGVVGLALWVLLLVSWFAMMAGAFVCARRRHEEDWAGFFLFIGCYALASLINATFDVALEGPMQGIWFWSLIGTGIGAVMIFRFKVAHSPGRGGSR